ncbi:hypothetical protein [Pseudonocardia sp. NPDC049635]|uniref:hypothetical protein n=1 Tax=Pseudonocardia sp. NPDC049635 TaxID=3155506 RepID=UPI0033F8AF66
MDTSQVRVANLLRRKLIPDSPSMPEIEDDEFGRDVERVLELRPDLETTVARQLAADDISSHDGIPAELVFVVAAAYYTNPRVDGALGYSAGQRRTAPLDEHSTAELRQRLSSVIARGPLYVPTP